MDPQASLSPGDNLEGRYVIAALLGEGGFGVVYKARQLTTGQDVAIKVLHPNISPTVAAQLDARFQREMSVIAHLKHPNIVRLLDSGHLPDGRLYTVLELIDGEELSDLLAREGSLGVGEAKRLLGQVMEALACAHGQGIVHRDLKPSNIMVTRAGRLRNAMVLDFGIATVSEDHDDPDFARLTQTGQIHGTPAYMAPEQLQGRVTAQCDIYAWGLTFVEALTGRPVVEGVSVASAIYQQLSPTPVTLPELDDASLLEVLRRATAKEAQRRYQSADEVLADLEALAGGALTAPLESGATALGTRREAVAARETLAEGEQGVAFMATEAVGPDEVAQVLAQTPRGGTARQRRGAWWAVLVVAVLVVAGGGLVWWSQAPGGVETGVPCPPGQVRSADTQGECCWPGQAWNGARCVGAPSRCPEGQLVNAAEQTCSLPPCEAGKHRPDGLHCCWEEQAWSESQGRCIGTPRCPPSSLLHEETCLALGADAWLNHTGCEAGNTRACVALGMMLQDGVGAERHPARAYALFAQACEAKNVAGCYYLAVATYLGLGCQADAAAAMKLWEQACRDGRAAACYDLAMVAEKQGGEGSGAAVLALLERACELEPGMACDALGMRYQMGLGVAADAPRARAYYAQACQAGYAFGCTHSAWMAGTLEETRALLSGACESAETFACLLLAGLLDGSAVSEAPLLRRRACEDGWIHACD